MIDESPRERPRGLARANAEEPRPEQRTSPLSAKLHTATVSLGLYASRPAGKHADHERSRVDGAV